MPRARTWAQSGTAIAPSAPEPLQATTSVARHRLFSRRACSGPIASAPSSAGSAPGDGPPSSMTRTGTGAPCMRSTAEATRIAEYAGKPQASRAAAASRPLFSSRSKSRTRSSWADAVGSADTLVHLRAEIDQVDADRLRHPEGSLVAVELAVVDPPYAGIGDQLEAVPAGARGRVHLRAIDVHPVACRLDDGVGLRVDGADAVTVLHLVADIV